VYVYMCIANFFNWSDYCFLLYEKYVANYGPPEKSANLAHNLLLRPLVLVCKDCHCVAGICT
jgi:hypothetical protein